MRRTSTRWPESGHQVLDLIEVYTHRSRCWARAASLKRYLEDRYAASRRGGAVVVRRRVSWCEQRRRRVIQICAFELLAVAS